MKNFADIHTHISNTEPQRIESMFDISKANGVTDIGIHSLAHFGERGGILQNIDVLAVKKIYSTEDFRIWAFTAFHEADSLFGNIPYAEQVKIQLALGADGIKSIQMKPNVRKRIGKGIDHESYDEVFAILEERGVPVMIHSGDPEDNWDITKVNEYLIKHGWYYGDGTHLSVQEHYDEVFRRLDKNPKLIVILAHFFFLSNRMDEAKRVLDKYPNAYFDVTPGWEMFVNFSKDIDAWQKFFEEYSDRIVYGTDCDSCKKYNEKIYQLVESGLTHDKSEVQLPCYSDKMIKGLDLTDEALEKIRYKNFARICKGEPKPVDTSALREYIEKMICVFGENEKYVAECERLRAYLTIV